LPFYDIITFAEQ